MLGFSVIIGTTDTGAQGTENTQVQSAIRSLYDDNGNSKVDVVTDGKSKDETGSGSGLDIYTSGALEKQSNNISNSTYDALFIFLSHKIRF